MNQNLIVIARGLVEHIHKMRELLPGVPDDKLLIIVEALATKVEPTDPTKDAPPTLAAAIVGILEKSGQASRGEIARAVERDGLGYLAQDKDLYGIVGRTLDNPLFERVHRGLYRLRKPVNTIASETDTVLHVAAKLPQPFLARDVTISGKIAMTKVISELKKLNRLGKVRVAQKLINGTARWEIV